MILIAMTPCVPEAWSLPELKLYAAVEQLATQAMGSRALQADGQDFDAASTVKGLVYSHKSVAEVSKAGEAMTQRFLQWAWTVSGAPELFISAVNLAGRYGQDG